MSVASIPIKRIGLSVRAEKALTNHNISTIGDLLDCPETELKSLPGVGRTTTDEILMQRERYDYFMDNPTKEPLHLLRFNPAYHDLLLTYIKKHDKELLSCRLTQRSMNCLANAGYKNISDIVFLAKQDLLSMPNMGLKSADEIVNIIGWYFQTHENLIRNLIFQGERGTCRIDRLKKKILEECEEWKFDGIYIPKLKIRLSEISNPEQIDQAIKELEKERKVKVKDFRCCKTYSSFSSCIVYCPDLSDKQRISIQMRLGGHSLQEIADACGCTRENARQTVNRAEKTVDKWHRAETGSQTYAEDRYVDLYSTYSVDAGKFNAFLGKKAMNESYMKFRGIRSGVQPLSEALNDDTVNKEIKQQISGYLHQNSLCIEGKWYPRQKIIFEEIAAKRFCQKDTAYSDFAALYNQMLDSFELQQESGLYNTKDSYHTRQNQLMRSDFLLWKLNGQMRYYDIKSRDYTDLLQKLNLEQYQDIELSTQKFMEEYAGTMAEYDIRDKYELHNLLRKIIPEGSFHNIQFKRMPTIAFGVPNRHAAILETIKENEPVSSAKLCQALHKKYGYDEAVTAANYLGEFSQYYHNGFYGTGHSCVQDEKLLALKNALTDSFYTMDEVKTTWKNLFPDESWHVTAEDLASIGFHSASNSVWNSARSQAEYFEKLFTSQDEMDISQYKKRFRTNTMFYTKLSQLKQQRQIAEIQPNRIISADKLAEMGLTPSKIQEFCDEVYAFVENSSYFSIPLLRKALFCSYTVNNAVNGIDCPDWLLADLLSSDERFSSGQCYGVTILYKGNIHVNIRSFLVSVIDAFGEISVGGLNRRLQDLYGCLAKPDCILLRDLGCSQVVYDKETKMLRIPNSVESN